MARLNEPPPSTESVDALKRRFLRQNRELAKTNSAQSVRIRNLENEGSRLLAENLSLREQVINLQFALENQSNGPSAENLQDVRDKLEAKMQELGTLVAELGQIQNPERKRRCKSQTAATRRSPDERNWRSGASYGQNPDGEDGKLPTITEDKYYPRKTLNADELRGLLEDADAQSPDLGPPPVARFDPEEPIQFDPRLSESEAMVENASDNLNNGENVMLETRRKRRESNPKLTIRRMSVFQASPEGGEEEASSNEKISGLKVGAKRKLSVREEEDAREIGETGSDTFQFSRRGTSNASVNDNEKNASTDSHPLNAPERKILGSKPVNTDPVLSPKKPRPSLSERSEPKKPAKPASRGRPPNRRPKFEPVDVAPVQTESAEIPLEFLPPKTPAMDDMFSPQSTNPSTQRPELRDTPPPADLNPSGTSTDANGLAGRAARRARAQVNYAEPNLISKMRRPTKELVDAVVPTREDRGSMTADPATGDPKRVRDVVIKRENEDVGSAWKSLPENNGADRDEVGEKDSPLSKKAGRQMAQVGHQGGNDFVPPVLNPSATAQAISKLVSATATSRRKSVQIAEADRSRDKSARKDESRDQPQDREREDKEGLAVYDFTDSSPADAPGTIRPRIDLAKQSKTNRRHSSVPAPSSSNAASGTRPSILKQPSAARSFSSTDLHGKNADERRMSSTTKRAGSTAAQGIASGEEGSEREGRAAGRRRSMMM